MSLLVHLLRVVSLPHWAQHWVRTVLTVVGVALGVATVVAVADINRSVSAAFERMVETVAGASALEVTSESGSVDETLVTTVARTPGVKAAAGLVEAFVGLSDRSDETLYLLGMDVLGSPVWEAQLPRDAIDIPDELVFLSKADSVLLGRGFADRIGVGEDDELRVVVPRGVQSLRVRGFLGDVPATRLFAGAIAVMDLPAAQRLLGREGQLDRVAIEVEPGVPVEPLRRRLADALGRQVQVAAPEARGAQLDKLLVSLRSMLTAAASFALIVGGLIVYQTVMVSVQQRRRQFALLDAVGIERSVLTHLCLVEIAALAVVGVAVGVLAGWGLASLASGIVGVATSEIWFPVQVTHAARSPSGLLIAAGTGLGIALAAAYVAARTTFNAPTVEALRPSAVEAEGRAPLASVVLGVALLAATWSMLLMHSTRPWLVVGALIAAQFVGYWAGALLGPAIVSGVGRAWRRLVGSSRWLPGRLAAENFPRSPRRTGITLATIAAACGMAVSMSGLVQSFDAAWSGWIRERFAADVFVGSGSRFRLLAGPPMGPEVRAALAAIPGVASVEPFRVIPIEFQDRPAFLQGVALDDRLRHGGLDMVEGDLRQAARALRDGSGVLLSDNLAFRLGLHRGDRVTVPTPAGPREFRVEGTFVDYLGSLDLGAVVVAEEQLAGIWNDHAANLFRVWLAPGASAAAVRAAVLERLGPGYYAITARQFLDAVQSVLRQFFVASWVLVLVAPLVGVIGVINSQLATVVDRWGEIAMLRTIGVSRRDLTRAVLLECGAIGTLGGLLGLALGAMLFTQFVTGTMRLLTGWRIPIVLPVLPLLAGVVAAGVIAAAAGWVPARLAVRLDARQQSLD
jgi:putative ABC transport system permease protein